MPCSISICFPPMVIIIHSHPPCLSLIPTRREENTEEGPFIIKGKENPEHKCMFFLLLRSQAPYVPIPLICGKTEWNRYPSSRQDHNLMLCSKYPERQRPEPSRHLNFHALQKRPTRPPSLCALRTKTRFINHHLPFLPSR